MSRLPVWIGFDRKEEEVYRVASASLQNTTPQAAVMPLVQDLLRAHGYYTRTKDSRAATDFSLTRFLVPWLSDRQGWAIFVDCDFLFTRDVIARLDPILDDSKAVMVVKHRYTPKHTDKMGGSTQHIYPRKNWSSFMVWNLEHEANQVLDPAIVNSADPSWLHQFKWLDDSEIGALPIEFNFLVGEYDPPEKNADILTAPTNLTPTCLHYTLGIDVFAPPTRDYTLLWAATKEKMLKHHKPTTAGAREIH